MPSDNSDKAYIKKHKINDLLNDLFTSLASSKPEDPLDFCYKYFESKVEPSLPPPPPPKPPSEVTTTARKFSIFGMGSEANQSMAAKSDSSKVLTDAAQQALNNLIAVQKVSRSAESDLTPEQILEKEQLVYRGKEYKSNHENEETTHRKIIKYKDEIKARDDQRRHKEQLEKIITRELTNMREAEKADEGVVTISRSAMEVHQDMKMDNAQDKDSDYDDLNAEINPDKVIKREKKKDKTRIRTIQKDSLQQTLARSDSTVVKLVICPNCAKVQQENLIGAEDAIKEEQVVMESTPSREVPPLEIKPTEETVTADNDQLKNIFDFFVKPTTQTKPVDSQPPPPDQINTVRTTDSFDDDHIESASQVSGPRPITPYEAPTSRSAREADLTGEKDNGVLGWLLNKQKYESQEKKIDPEVQSNTSRTLVSERRPSSGASSTAKQIGKPSGGGGVTHRIGSAERQKSQGSVVSASTGHQKWKVKDDSGSETSSRNKK